MQMSSLVQLINALISKHVCINMLSPNRWTTVAQMQLGLKVVTTWPLENELFVVNMQMYATSYFKIYSDHLFLLETQIIERLIFFCLYLFAKKKGNCTAHSVLQCCLSVWPPLLTTERQGHCKWLSLRRQFTCWLVLIQTDEGGQLCVSVCSRVCWMEEDGEAECMVLSAASMFVHLNVARTSKCVHACVWTPFLPCISDELKSPWTAGAHTHRHYVSLN